MTKLKSSIFDNLAVVLGVACLGLIIVAGLMLAAHCYVWLKYGYWEPYSVSTLLFDLKLGLPTIPRVQPLQRMIELAASMPAWACLTALAGLCYVAGKLLTNLAGQRSRSRQSR